ncbi:Methyltransferase domain-containing protein [Lachnospiraceae bacterium C10]|nr:Methyltransferase domain-containing protein [Lachnospiraceae bacterium C10]
MDKNAIKKYAVWARTELITRVSQRAEKYDITAEADASASSVNGVLLSDAEIKQRKALIEQVKQKGFDQVMEEVAYTWFNRFIALRFMEVNGYLPSHIRVFTDDNNNFKPQILAEAIHLELDGLDMDKVYEMKNNNENDELYKYLLITQCNDLSKVLPGMFQKIADYTELLFPDNVLREGSVIEQMISIIPENNWDVHAKDSKGVEQGQVQIIGWLYQYYNTELKDEVFTNLKKNIKIEKEKIPAATQLFTPDWIVRYMVENSLGRMWIEGHPDSSCKSEWKYYMDEINQDEDVVNQLESIYKERKDIKPEDIKCIDPCCGSGHILAYIFDVLIKIYEEYGVSSSEATRKIVQNNIWGLDIDDRAAQLAYFSVMMKATEYDRRFLRRKGTDGKLDIPQPHIYAIGDSALVDTATMDYFVGNNMCIKESMHMIVEKLKDAKNLGAIIEFDNSIDFSILFDELEKKKNEISIYAEPIKNYLEPVITIAWMLSQKYHIVITNPPYMGNSGMNSHLATYVKNNYPDSKTDLFSVFMDRCTHMVISHGFSSLVTMQSWMFLASFEKFRKRIIRDYTITSLMHMDNMVMHIAFGTAVTVICNAKISGYKGAYNQILNANINENDEPNEFPVRGNRLAYISVNNFADIPGELIAYWLSDAFLNVFKSGVSLGKMADSKQGIATANNKKYLREWFEVNYSDISFNTKSHEEAKKCGKKWFPYNKGGEYRKWYGNNDYVVDWYDDGRDLKNNKKAVLRNPDYYFRECFSWSLVSSGMAAFRYKPIGHLFDVAGMSCFSSTDLKYLLGLCNSMVTTEILKVVAPTINYQCGDIANIPVINSEEYKKQIEDNVNKCIELSKEDWDSFEISWDFKKNPLIECKTTGFIEDAFNNWKDKTEERFKRVHEYECENNKAFVNIYGLQNEIDESIPAKYISIRKADRERDIQLFISYAVGCMFGRYSLKHDGIVYAGGEFNTSAYDDFSADVDNIIPICDDEYFEDDIVGKFVDFVKYVFGEQDLEINLNYIAESLGGGGQARDVIRKYFLNDFYSFHVKQYQKRPIYWLFDSGKENSFKCLIYIHRYRSDTIARIRTDYVHEQQSRYRTAIEEITGRISNSTGSEKVRLNKQLEKLKLQNDEIYKYEEKIHHLADQMITLDLNDGVTNNYQKFADVLAKLK